MLKSINIKDIYGRIIKPNEKVGVLVKDYCYGGIRRADLRRATYLGKGQYGYEFKFKLINNKDFIVRIRYPQCVMKGGKRYA